MKLNTFLNYGGNCEAALRFYEKHLGGSITMMMRRSGAPDPQVGNWPGWEQSIQYAAMKLGDTELMASDVQPDRFQPMRSVYLTLTLADAAEAERVWGLLADEGSISMPMQETFYAYRFGQLRDKFGTLWMIMALKPQTR